MAGQLILGLSILVGLHELGHLVAAKVFGMLSTVKEAEEKKDVILKKRKEREPTTAAMTTTKAAKDVLAEK